MALKTSEIRRLKASRAIDVAATRSVIQSQFDKRMILDIETSPLNPQIIWMFVGPDCEAFSPDERQRMADTIARSWSMFDGVELINLMVTCWPDRISMKSLNEIRVR